MESVRCRDYRQQSLDSLSGAEADSQAQGGPSLQIPPPPTTQKVELGHSSGGRMGRILEAG